MNPQDVNNISQWLQEILRLVQDTRTQLIDMRGENKQMMDDIRGIAARIEQKDTSELSLIENLRTQLDIVKGSADSAKSAAEHANDHLDSKINDLKSILNDIKNQTR